MTVLLGYLHRNHLQRHFALLHSSVTRVFTANLKLCGIARCLCSPINELLMQVTIRFAAQLSKSTAEYFH
jgi:hypothetical protein